MERKIFRGGYFEPRGGVFTFFGENLFLGKWHVLEIERDSIYDPPRLVRGSGSTGGAAVWYKPRRPTVQIGPPAPHYAAKRVMNNRTKVTVTFIHHIKS
jgi:hypothetical protein